MKLSMSNKADTMNIRKGLGGNSMRMIKVKMETGNVDFTRWDGVNLEMIAGTDMKKTKRWIIKPETKESCRSASIT